jgi:hypothetical protein
MVTSLIRTFSVIGLLTILLSGCMYRNEITKSYAPPTGEFIVLVQNAVDEFHKRTGVLPIKNKAQDTPVYEKYQIDFKKLQNYNLLSSIPPNAFENGGTAIYAIVNPETKPEVKLIDLTVYQLLVDIQAKTDEYKWKNGGKLPLGTGASPHFHVLDLKELGIHQAQVPSPYSRTFLNVLIDDNGEVGIDYAPEIMKAIQKSGKTDFPPDQDLRSILVEQAYFVPARSFPYHWKDREPVPVMP